MNVEQTAISSHLMNTNQVYNNKEQQCLSKIQQQCISILQTVPELKNLTYRVTKNYFGNEILIIYREGIFGIFGPPVEPISLTMDPKGKCLLSILFKPAQQVSIASPSSEHIDITSLLALLRLISGTGYLFCPGIPEKFLTKMHEKFMMLHKVPFKRYQSVQCPVYYQLKGESSVKSTLCVICPRCIHAVNVVKLQPTAVTPTQQPPQPSTFGQLFPDMKLPIQDSCNNNSITNSELSNSVFSISLQDRQNMKIDLIGISHEAVGVNDSNCIADKSALADDNKEAKTQKNKSVLRQRAKKKIMVSSDNIIYTKDIRTLKNYASNHSFVGIKKKQERKGIVCHYCRRQFSTPTKLQGHIQKHCLLYKKLWRHRTGSSALHRKLIQGAKMATFHRNKLSNFSKKSRFFQKTFKDVSPLFRAKSIKQKNGKIFDGAKVLTEAEKCVRQKSNMSGTDQAENRVNGTRSGLKRNSPCPSSLPSLLQATALNVVRHNEVSKCTQINVTEDVEVKVPYKKQRTCSPKPTFKKNKSSQIETGKKDNYSGTDSVFVSQENSLLINLNLLSTVSVETSLREGGTNTLNYGTISDTCPVIHSTESTSSLPVVSNTLQPAMKSSEKLTSKYAISNYLHRKDNTLQLEGSQSKETIQNVISKQTLLQYPSLTASAEGKTSLDHVPSQNRQNQSQSGHSSPVSLMNQVMSDDKKLEILHTIDKVLCKNYSISDEQKVIDLSKHAPNKASVKNSSNDEKDLDLNTESGPCKEVIMKKHSFKEFLNSLKKNIQNMEQVNSISRDKNIESYIQAGELSRSGKGLENGQKKQSVIRSNILTQLEKGVKPPEIQCGYMWSGSGGLVKERMLRAKELVPSAVMTNLLANTVLQPSYTGLYNDSKSHSTKASTEVIHPPPVTITKLSTSLTTISSQPVTVTKSNPLVISQHITVTKSNPSVTAINPQPVTATKLNPSITPITLQSVTTNKLNPSITSQPVTATKSNSGITFQSDTATKSDLSVTSQPVTDTKSNTEITSQFIAATKSDLSITSQPVTAITPRPFTTTSEPSIRDTRLQPYKFVMSTPSLARTPCKPVSVKLETRHDGITRIAKWITTSSATLAKLNNDAVESSKPVLGRSFNVETEPVDHCSLKLGSMNLTRPAKTEKFGLELEKSEVKKWDSELEESEVSRDSEDLPMVIDLSPHKSSCKRRSLCL